LTDIADHAMEQTLFKVLEFQSRENIARQDVLLTMSLLSLMGILDYLQKGRSEMNATPGTVTNNDQMMNMLLSILGNSGAGTGTPQAGQSFNPALLLPLLVSGRGGGQPDQAMLMGLLSSLISNKSGSPPGITPRQESTRRESTRPPVSQGGGRKGEVLRWGVLPGQKSGPKETSKV